MNTRISKVVGRGYTWSICVRRLYRSQAGQVWVSSGGGTLSPTCQLQIARPEREMDNTWVGVIYLFLSWRKKKGDWRKEQHSVKRKRKREERKKKTHRKSRKLIWQIRMISTRQCSLFTIACPMPACFVEKGGERKLKTVNIITIVT